MIEREPTPKISCLPITPANLADLDSCSSEHGRFRYCSCMRWRMTSTEYQRSTMDARVKALEDMVRRSQPVGVLAYVDSKPVGGARSPSAPHLRR